MANQTLISMTADTSPSTTALIYMVEDPGGTPLNRKITVPHLMRIINGLTADSTPDRTADYVATWDNSASDAKKVLLQNVGPYAIAFGMTEDFSPADATTYYFGSGKGMTTTQAVRRVRFPRAGIVRGISLMSALTAGSNENSTISLRLDNTTDTTISSTVDCSANPVEIINTSLSVSVSQNTYFEIKWVTPTWATNPTAMQFSGVIWVC